MELLGKNTLFGPTSVNGSTLGGQVDSFDDELDTSVRSSRATRTSGSIGSVSSGESSLVLAYPPTPWEVFAYGKTITPEQRAALITFSKLPSAICIGFCTALTTFKQSDGSNFEIRDNLSYEIVTRPKEPEKRYIFSQEFMSGAHRCINANLTYTADGLVYEKFDQKARVLRGVPVDEESSQLLARWATQSLNPKHFPCWPEQNAALGQFVRIWRPNLVMGNITFDPDLYYDRESKIFAEFSADVTSYLNQRLRTERTFKDTIQAFHEIQQYLWQNRNTIGKRLIALAAKKEKEFREFSARPENFPAVPVPSSMPDIRTVEADQAKNRGTRNKGIMGQLFHHQSDQSAGTAYDAHKIEILKVAYDLAGPKAFYEVTAYQAVTLTHIGCPVKVYTGQPECEHIVTLGTTVPGLTPGKRVIDCLYGAKSNVKWVTAHFSILDFADLFTQANNRDVFNHWKVLGTEKRSSFHTPDFIMRFERSEEVLEENHLEVVAKGSMIALTACVGERHVQRLYESGLIASTFEFSPYRVQFASGPKSIPAQCKYWNLDWVPFTINNCATVVGPETAAQDEDMFFV